MSKVQHSDALEARARKIVEALGGTWSRSRGMCCCPAHSDRTPSLSITLGKRAILVHCFAGCTNEAVIQAMARLGVRIADLFDGPAGPITNEPRVDTANRNAFRLWLESSVLAGTPGERYLAGRGIAISSPEMRFHPRMPLGPKGAVRFLPALVAAVRNDACILAVGRIFLDPDTGGRARPGRLRGPGIGRDHARSRQGLRRDLGSGDPGPGIRAGLDGLLCSQSGLDPPHGAFGHGAWQRSASSSRRARCLGFLAAVHLTAFPLRSATWAVIHCPDRRGAGRQRSGGHCGRIFCRRRAF